MSSVNPNLPQRSEIPSEGVNKAAPTPPPRTGKVGRPISPSTEKTRTLTQSQGEQILHPTPSSSEEHPPVTGKAKPEPPPRAPVNRTRGAFQQNVSKSQPKQESPDDLKKQLQEKEKEFEPLYAKLRVLNKSAQKAEKEGNTGKHKVLIKEIDNVISECEGIESQINAIKDKLSKPAEASTEVAKPIAPPRKGVRPRGKVDPNTPTPPPRSAAKPAKADTLVRQRGKVDPNAPVPPPTRTKT